MIEDTLLSFTTQNTIFIKKLYYDLIDKQFIVNSDEINHSQINNLLKEIDALLIDTFDPKYIQEIPNTRVSTINNWTNANGQLPPWNKKKQNINLTTNKIEQKTYVLKKNVAGDKKIYVTLINSARPVDKTNLKKVPNNSILATNHAYYIK